MDFCKTFGRMLKNNLNYLHGILNLHKTDVQICYSLISVNEKILTQIESNWTWVCIIFVCL